MATKGVNVFSEGLLMDFHPLNADGKTMSNALNATLTTSNGNELMLQQDMGNGRVETAYLPEGYVPIGTCEFGDIIYIVSYNPLENKSQIGCFPSPERNITSDEVTEMEQGISWKDFQEAMKDGNNNDVPSGVLKATSVKKIVYGNKNLNPGDKYIIYEASAISGAGVHDGALGANKNDLSDYLNSSHKHDAWPKLVKLRVVSIEDSGRIVDLDASVKWYDNDFYIPFLYESNGNIDIDSYRSLVSSAYSIFKSKVSGKLAILAELETIENFSCAYEVYVTEEEAGVQDYQKTSNVGNDIPAVSNSVLKYDIWFYTSWTTSHNDVNPSGFVLTNSAWTTTDTDSLTGGKLNYPVSDGAGGIKYVKSDTLELPVKAYDVSDDGRVMYGYTRIYALDNPSESYEEYCNSESYNAQIDNIVDWMKVVEDERTVYKAIAGDDTVADHEHLRNVTQITKCVDKDGKPSISEESDGEIKYSKKGYVYNLDDYIIVKGNTDETPVYRYRYYTKKYEGGYVRLNEVELTDDVVNNYFGKDIATKLNAEGKEYKILKSTTFLIDDEEDEWTTNMSGLVWDYTVAPFMPYGILDFLSVSGTIDFSKIGSGEIELTAWRYYSSENTLTLTWGLDAYIAPNMGIAEVVFDFYDNQGRAASYHIKNKTSFAGTFTETFYLSDGTFSGGLSATDAYGEEYIHAGAEDDSGTVYLRIETNNKGVETSDYKPYTAQEVNKNKEEDANNVTYKQCTNDAGTLYAICVYLTKITVKYCPKDIMGRFNTENEENYKTFYRWLIPNGYFNENYYSTKDFDILQTGLTTDFSATLSTVSDSTHMYPINSMEAKTVEYYNTDELKWEEGDMNDNIYKTLGANVYAINQEAAYNVTETEDSDGNVTETKTFIGNKDDVNGNVFMTLNVGITNGFGTFKVVADEYGKLPATVYLGKSSIKKDIDSPSIIYSDSDKKTGFEDSLQPIINDELDKYNRYRYDDGKAANFSDNPYTNKSGYFNAAYGELNSFISKHLLDLLEGEVMQVKAFSSKELDIYDSSTNYANYKDSFSLNFAYNTIDHFGENYVYKEDGELIYYDGDGNEVIVKDYAYITGTAMDLCSHASETDSTKNVGGLQFTLTGIMFSKIFAGELTKNSDVRTLRSVIATEDLLNASGMHYYKNNIYFSNLLAIGASRAKHSGHAQYTWAHTACLTNSNSFYDKERSNVESDTNTASDGKEAAKIKGNESFDNNAFQTFLKNWSAGANIMAFAFAKNDSGSENDTLSITADSSFASIRSTFGAEGLGSKERNVMIATRTEGVRANFNISNEYDRKEGKFYPYCFAVVDKDTNENIYPIADFFAGDLEYYTDTHYVFGIHYTTINYLVHQSVDENEYWTLANMVASLYSQLYAVDADSKNIGILISNFVTTEKFTESWHKDIIVEVKTDDLDQSTITDCIAICDRPAKEYLNCMATNGFGIKDFADLEEIGVNFNNINFELYGFRRAIDFRFDVPYDIGNLRYTYEEMSQVMHHLYPFDKDPSEGYVRVYGNVNENVLYTYDRIDSVQKFSSTSILYYIKKDDFKTKKIDDVTYLYGKIDEDSEQIARNNFGGLSNVLQYDSSNGVTWHDVSQLDGFSNKYSLENKIEDHTSKITWEDIPKCKIFNKYNPGS